MPCSRLTSVAGGRSRLCSFSSTARTSNSRPASGSVVLVLICTVILSALGFTQSLPRNQLSQYTSAVAHVDPAERLRQLKQFATVASPGPLKIDALTFVIADDLRSRNHQDAWQWASMLRATESDNPVALALITDRSRYGHYLISNDELLSISKRGLDAVPRMRRPLGMNQNDFALLNRQVQAMLKGSAGYAELQRGNYLRARQDLHDALALDPDNLQNIYALGLADIDGKPSAAREGYMYLARAVDLSRGTPEGTRMAQYARDRYMKDGGSSENWNQYLASAAQQNPMQPQTAVLARSVPKTAAATPSTVVAAKRSAKPATVVAASRPVQPPPRSKTGAPASVWADDTVTMPIPRKHVAPNANGPISLGILIETSLTTKENRSAVLNSLSDMLRHLSDQDEAFILSYDNNLVFEEDLTTDPQQLEEAMKEIRPQHGAVLDDAVAFAAGHLARIAKYPHRVLLVVSDGRNADSNVSPTQTSAEINAAGVKIYCIGMDVEDQDGRYRLQALSSGTGGASNFISSPQQFRRATVQIAQNMGIDFRF